MGGWGSFDMVQKNYKGEVTGITTKRHLDLS